MGWSYWMRSRVVRLAIAAMVSLPLGAPSVFASVSLDELRQPDTRSGPAHSRISSDLSGPAAGSAYSRLSKNDRFLIDRILPGPDARNILAGAYLGELSLEEADAQLASIVPDPNLRSSYLDLASRPTNLLGDASQGSRGQLRTIAARMVPPTGGILAADESTGTAGRRLASVGIEENTPEHRQAMRRVLLTTPGLNANGVNAVILDRDTLTNTVSDDSQTRIVDYLLEQGIVPGLKTDEGLVDDDTDYGTAGVAGLKRPKDPELTTLPALLEQANASGVEFTKFRTTIPVGAPEANMRLNASVQAQQAKLTQAAGLLPIVEPEVIFDGSDGSVADHDLAASYATTTRMQELTFEALAEAEVALDGVILKTSMVLAGKNAPAQTDPETVGVETLRGLLKTVPAQVPAVVFLSGGQSDDQATENLAAVTRISQTRFAEVRDAAVTELRAEGQTARAEEVAALTQAPWELSYSFGRGLQAPALAAWGGQADQVAEAQQAMLATAQKVQGARIGVASREVAEALANANAPFVAGTPDHTPEVTFKAVNMAAVGLVAEGFRGNAVGVEDKALVSDLKQQSDGRAKQIVQAVFIDAGERGDVQVSEGFGRDEVEESFRGLDVINARGLGRIKRLFMDVIEGTNKFALLFMGKLRSQIGSAESGATSAVVTGEGIAPLGNSSDAYADQFLASVPEESRAEVQRFIEAHVEAEDEAEIQEVLNRVATANGLTLDDLEVVLMERKREGKRLASLQAIQARNSGMEITQILDGTVAHGLLATFGRKSGQMKIVWTVGGSAEAFMNLGVAASVPGGIGALRQYSVNVNKAADGSDATDLSQRYAFSEDEKAEMRRMRPDDYEQVLAGQRVLTINDVNGPVEGNFSFITHNGVFNQPEVEEIRPGVFRVHTLRVRNGAPSIVVEDIPVEEVQQILARAPWVGQEPAAADPAAVDEAGTLLALMKNTEHPQTMLIHEDLSLVTPGFFIAWQRALDQFRAERGLATLDEAAGVSAVKLTVAVTGVADDAAAAERLNKLVQAINDGSQGATQLKPSWFTASYTKPAEPVAVAIGPSDWLGEVSDQAPVKVAFDPADDGQARSGAAALYAGAEAVANDGKLPPEVLTKLDILDDAGLFVPQAVAIAPEVESIVQTYRATVEGV